MVEQGLKFIGGSMKYSNCKEISWLVNDAIKRGWKYTVSPRGHAKLRLGRYFVCVSKTPSCPHAYKEFEKDIKRIEAVVNV